MFKPWLSAALVACLTFWVLDVHAQQKMMSNVPSTVVAKQGEAVLTLTDIDAFAGGIPSGDRPAFFNSPKRLQALLTNLLLQKQLAAQARKEGLDKDPGVQQQMALSAEEALGKAQMQHFKDTIKLPNFDKLAREEFIAHKEKYGDRGNLDVKHILISAKDRSKDEAKVLADRVLAEAKAHPDQFDALVEKYSDDSSKSTNHGLMRDVNAEGHYAPEFAKAAKALKTPGEISPITQTSFGYHIIQLVEKSEPKPRTFEQAGPEITAKLKTEYVNKTVADYADGLRNNVLDTNPDLIDSLRDRYGSVPAIPGSNR